MIKRQRISITGRVQGVGCRPFIHSLAAKLHLTGCVYNDTKGVHIELQGPEPKIQDFLKLLRSPKDSPALLEITSISGEHKGMGIPGAKITDKQIEATVQAAADMLGFDLLNIANEGKVIIVVAEDSARDILKICRSDPLGKDAAIIGTVRKPQGAPVVELITKIGGKRIVQTPYGRELPRIC